MNSSNPSLRYILALALLMQGWLGAAHVHGPADWAQEQGGEQFVAAVLDHCDTCIQLDQPVILNSKFALSSAALLAERLATQAIECADATAATARARGPPLA